jgi:alpha-glucosidase (family GH31 glycosyl hydrolase)
MVKRWNRRELLQLAGRSSALLFAPKTAPALGGLQVAGRDCEVHIGQVSEHALRLSILPVGLRSVEEIPDNGALLQKSWGAPLAKLQHGAQEQIVECRAAKVLFSSPPVTLAVITPQGQTIQKISVDEATGAVSFLTGDGPLLGLGEGGPQFDRRGSVDRMIGGQQGYRLTTHGGRVPIPWLIGTSGWAIFFNQPFGAFDFTSPQSKFQPTSPDKALPLDLFVVVSSEPATILGEYARLTGHPEMPPLWSLGYQQSHRTLASEEEILGEAKTFREKRLPCDTMIYLGTGFCPSGWNTANGSFVWNSRVFPKPEKTLRELHEQNFRAVVHVVILSDRLHGTAREACNLSRFDETQASCYWDAHREAFAMGVDGWWPDEGDALDIASRLVRNRMYWEAPQIDRPNERPYALHRNGYAGMQRYSSFLWSGDVYSTWETLKTQVPIGINAGLTGIPYWGTDIGGFVPTTEFTAELYLRWFQFGAFCPLFRCHGRAWKLRLPWGWNTGDTGPSEINSYSGASLPDTSQLHNAQVEPICRKYLELRYRMLPYLYSAVREGAATGMPVMRALWLHYPDDPKALVCGDQYLWGENLLVAPVVEKGAQARRVYLPRAGWYDFWTGERVEGGREINREVDLQTIPVYVREGSILPLGPVKQYAAEKVDEPMTLAVYPGKDSAFLLYEDDGISFNYRKGEWMGIQITWREATRALTLRLAQGSRMLPPMLRKLQVTLGQATQSAAFDGKPLTVTF